MLISWKYLPTVTSIFVCILDTNFCASPICKEREQLAAQPPTPPISSLKAPPIKEKNPDRKANKEDACFCELLKKMLFGIALFSFQFRDVNVCT